MAQGKDYLVVYKPGKTKRFYYFIGDDIKIRPVRNFPSREGVIQALSDSAIYFSANDSVHLSEIASVVIREDGRLLNKNMWLANLIAATGAVAIWEVMYQVNTGDWSPDVKTAPAIIGFVTLTPILINRIAVLFRRTECPVGPGAWRVGTVIMPKS